MGSTPTWGDDPELRAAIGKGYFSEAQGDAAIQRAMWLRVDGGSRYAVKLLKLILSTRESGLGPCWGTQDDHRIERAQKLLSQYEAEYNAQCEAARQDLDSKYFVPTDTHVLVGDDPVLRVAIDKGFFKNKVQGEAAIQRALWLRRQGRPRDATELLLLGDGREGGNWGFPDDRRITRAGKLRTQCEADYDACTSDTPASVYMANLGFKFSFSEDEYEG
jgi:hypothetical protein